MRAKKADAPDWRAVVSPSTLARAGCPAREAVAFVAAAVFRAAAECIVAFLAAALERAAGRGKGTSIGTSKIGGVTSLKSTMIHMAWVRAGRLSFRATRATMTASSVARAALTSPT